MNKLLYAIVLALSVFMMSPVFACDNYHGDYAVATGVDVDVDVGKLMTMANTALSVGVNVMKYIDVVPDTVTTISINNLATTNIDTAKLATINTAKLMATKVMTHKLMAIPI